MGLIETLGLPVEHKDVIIAALEAQFKRHRAAALAQRNLKDTADLPTGEEFIIQQFKNIAVTAWKNAEAAKAKEAVDEKLKV